jgi:hypothetical protein
MKTGMYSPHALKRAQLIPIKDAVIVSDMVKAPASVQDGVRYMQQVPSKPGFARDSGYVLHTDAGLVALKSKTKAASTQLEK